MAEAARGQERKAVSRDSKSIVDRRWGVRMGAMIGSRTVLAVRDLRISTQFFIEVLGFRRDFGDGSDGWSFLSRDHVKVMLGECPDDPPAGELGSHSYVAYVTVEGIDSLHQEIAKRSVGTIAEPLDEPWGMREFGIRTPDGHRIRFGEPIAGTSAAGERS